MAKTLKTWLKTSRDLTVLTIKGSIMARTVQTPHKIGRDLIKNHEKNLEKCHFLGPIDA